MAEFQNSQFDPSLPRYKNASNRLAKIRLHEMDWGAFLRKTVEKLRLKLIDLMGAK